MDNLGILLTLAVAFIFWRHRQTPVIKASGRELSGILLLATLCSFAMTFLIASRPSGVKCAVTRFSLGLTHTVAFAAIAVKTNRYINYRHCYTRQFFFFFSILFSPEKKS